MKLWHRLWAVIRGRLLDAADGRSDWPREDWRPGPDDTQEIDSVAAAFDDAAEVLADSFDGTRADWAAVDLALYETELDSRTTRRLARRLDH